MDRATFEVGREPAKPDPLWQIPVNCATAPDERSVADARRAIAALIARNQRERADEAV